MSKPVTAAIIGLGNRGRDVYANYALEFPDDIKIVAAADISPQRVAEAAEAFGIAPENCFTDPAELLAREKLADAVFICTPDQLHAVYAIPALKKGYHLLLEKPIAPNPEDCEAILKAARESGRHVAVCHVLRYTVFYREIKRLLDEGCVGEIVAVDAIENVGYYHQAHSFVRGNWRNAEQSSPMILQKCCHDFDVLLWLAGKKPKAVSSFGGLYLFRRDKAPEGAAKRCLDGCEAREACPFDAEKIYITDTLTGLRHSKIDWPCSVLTPVRTEEAVYEALREGPYGRCVYHCDNNVVDHQVVNIELEDGATVSLTLSGLTSTQYRAMKIMGTRGDIDADTQSNTIKVTEFGKEARIIDVNTLSEDFSGHGGGDNQMMREFASLIRQSGEVSAASSIERSMESHFTAFAAEKSRLVGGARVELYSNPM